MSRLCINIWILPKLSEQSHTQALWIIFVCLCRVLLPLLPGRVGLQVENGWVTAALYSMLLLWAGQSCRRPWCFTSSVCSATSCLCFVSDFQASTTTFYQSSNWSNYQQFLWGQRRWRWSCRRASGCGETCPTGQEGSWEAASCASARPWLGTVFIHSHSFFLSCEYVCVKWHH